MRVAGEGGPWIGHLEGVVEQDDVAFIRDPQLGEGFDDVEAHPGGVESRVVGHGGPAEHEGDPPVGEVEAGRHLARAGRILRDAFRGRRR